MLDLTSRKQEYFGYNQKAFTDEEWNKLIKQVKASPYAKYKYHRWIIEAEHQSKRFQNLALASGLVFFLVFLKLPILRIQPGYIRISAAGGFSYAIYVYGMIVANNLRMKRSIYAVRSHIVDHHGNQKVFL